jgi:DNA-binding NtrC family response regulator
MKKVIVIDCNLSYAESLREFFKNSLGIECIIYTFPYIAIREIKEGKNVDVVITEYQMPDVNGFIIANMVHRINPNITVIVTNKRGIDYLNKRLKEQKIIGKLEVASKHDMDFFTDLIS